MGRRCAGTCCCSLGNAPQGLVSAALRCRRTSVLRPQTTLEYRPELLSPPAQSFVTDLGSGSTPYPGESLCPIPTRSYRSLFPEAPIPPHAAPAATSSVAAPVQMAELDTAMHLHRRSPWVLPLPLLRLRDQPSYSPRPQAPNPSDVRGHVEVATPLFSHAPSTVRPTAESDQDSEGAPR